MSLHDDKLEFETTSLKTFFWGVGKPSVNLANMCCARFDFKMVSSE